MERTNSRFRIDLKGQPSEVENYHWEVDDSFFARLESTEVSSGSVDVSLQVRRIAEGEYKLAFRFCGDVEVRCDRCMESMQLPVAGENELTVQLGWVSGGDGDDERIEDSDGMVDVEWSIYEMIVLQIPLRHVHKEGECGGETSDLLRRYVSNDRREEKSADHRWDALKEI